MAKVSTAIATAASTNVAADANLTRLVVINVLLSFRPAEGFCVFLYFLKENIFEPLKIGVVKKDLE
jgi:hypothetical protein